MKVTLPLARIKKIKTNFNKWFTTTQLKDKGLLIKLGKGFINFYGIESNVVIGMSIHLDDIVESDIVYKCSYKDFESLKYIGKAKDLIDVIINKDEQKIYFSNEENNLFIEIKTFEKENEIIKLKDSETIQVNNFSLENTFEFLKNISPKNDEIEALNYTNLTLDNDLYVSACNLIAVGINKLKVENPNAIKWTTSIHNDYVTFLLKWLKSNSSIETNIFINNDIIYVYGKDSFIKIPICKNETICKTNNALIKFKDIENDKKYNLNLKEIKEGIKNELLPYKGDNQLSEKCIPYEFNINNISKKINSYQLNKIIAKTDNVELYLLNNKDNAPIIVLDGISNTKIIFNVIAN